MARLRFTKRKPDGNHNDKTIFVKDWFTYKVMKNFVSCRWFFGRRPEFVDPKVVAQGEGREGIEHLAAGRTSSLSI